MQRITTRKKSGVNGGSSKNLSRVRANGAGVEAEALLNEIDNLALLLHEVRKQTDKIEAAADAIGDAILTRLDPGRKTLGDVSRTTRRPVLSIPPKNSPRLRALQSAPQMNDARP